MRDALGNYREPMKVVLEANGSWGPMHDWLAEIADEVSVLSDVPASESEITSPEGVGQHQG